MPLFPGYDVIAIADHLRDHTLVHAHRRSEFDELQLVAGVLGAPPRRLWPKAYRAMRRAQVRARVCRRGACVVAVTANVLVV
jgi:lambda repressor-like predicted transcriptional regulator